MPAIERRGLTLVDELAAEGSLDGYHLLPSVRGDLLAKLGRLDEARTELERRRRSRATSANACCCSSEPDVRIGVIGRRRTRDRRTLHPHCVP